MDELTIKVEAKLSVSKETAEGCLKLVQIYINENDVDVAFIENIDGTMELRFLPRTKEESNDNR